MDTLLADYGTCGSTPITYSNNAPGCGFGSKVSVPVYSGSTYLVRVGGTTSAVAGTLATSCASADLDGDGLIGAADLGLLLGGWGEGGPSDLDGSGATDAVDLGILIGAWGPV